MPGIGSTADFVLTVPESAWDQSWAQLTTESVSRRLTIANSGGSDVSVGTATHRDRDKGRGHQEERFMNHDHDNVTCNVNYTFVSIVFKSYYFIKHF